ncbi:MAG: hypothetical protein WAM14_06590 [Candidatus Nitrosopolaris sp.]
MLTVPPVSGHTEQFDVGFKAGWLDVNADSMNGNTHTYWQNCTKQY